MEKHLEANTILLEHSFKIQHAVEQGLAKLRKYSIPAKLHHSYILGTGKSCYFLNIKCRLRHHILWAIVLHPCLRSHWFAATADLNDEAAQEEAIKTVEVIFKYIAETYLDTPTSSTPATVIRLVTKPIVRMPSFLASACTFQRPTTAAAMTILKCTPQEELSEELTRYIDFEAAPIESPELRQEGGKSSDKPTAHEVLLNPLLWWKVSTLFAHLYLSDDIHSDACFRISYHRSDGSRLSCNSCNKCLCWTCLLKVPAHLQQSPQLFEGEDSHDGITDKGLDTEWAVWDDATESTAAEAWWQWIKIK